MSNRTILALGADIKNKFLVSKGRGIFFGPEIGDLSDADNYELFKKETLKLAKKRKPDTVSYDLHPGYFSSAYAREVFSGSRLQPVQHHHAHIASVMSEHELKRPVIGVTFDGTGYGTDGNSWGGEFLKVNTRGFERLAHFKYRMMPGGDAVVREPWRMALSILGKKALPFLGDVRKEDINIALLMMSKGINSPPTSSAGRLFDACSALMGICTYASYEAEGPIKLEALCDEGIEEGYDFSIEKEAGSYIINTDSIFLGILSDLKKIKKPSLIATKFHNSMADVITKTVNKFSKKLSLKDVVLSGGVFQNTFLKKKTIKKLSGIGVRTYMNEKMSVNDFNIALGQYYVSCNTR
ncbi:MAG: carbamoyltransferase HypF [Candidatus Omnitrophica bacterium]|nr:carbamoyltransferase HypF [Candidatus Omnitrophota bacterium]